MHFKKALVASAVAGSAVAQRPMNTSICDYYTTALLKNNTAENQYTLLTLLVNTVVIGNYTMPNVGVKVPGILAKGQFNGADVNLLPYFNGMLASSNRGGMSGVSVNFLDGGGAAPLMMNKPANDTKSNQYFLLTHLYEFFGALLGCTHMGPNGDSPFPAYTGHTSMYDVHKFMDLGPNENGYFITQVGLAAASFGVADDDVKAAGTALTSLFNMRCAAPAKVLPTATAELQAICIRDACPLATDAVCASYAPAVMPMNATMTMSGGAMTSSMPSGSMTMTGGSMTMTGGGMTTTGSTAKPTASTAGASKNGLGMMAVAGGFAALML